MRKNRIIILILLSVLLLVNCSKMETSTTAPTGQTTDQASDVALKTPEEAITFYLDGVARNDVHKILQACAIDESAGNSNSIFTLKDSAE